MCVGLAQQQYKNSYWRLSSVEDTHEKEAISEQCICKNMHGFNIIKNYELISRSEEKPNFLITLTNADSHNLLYSHDFLKK